MSRDGFIFAATGDEHVVLARRAARTLRGVMPDAQIDLFTDAPLDDPVFDQIHRLKKPSERPKIEALGRSRFKHCVHLDSDVIVIADLSDVFALLRRHDVVGAHENYRNSPSSRSLTDRPDIPNSFPEINTGVLGIRKNMGTKRLLRRWRKAHATSTRKHDQPPLRELLFDGRHSLAVLPMDYNLMHTKMIQAMGELMTAPRTLHVTRLSKNPDHWEDPTAPYSLRDLLSADVFQALVRKVQTDLTLTDRDRVLDRLFS